MTSRKLLFGLALFLLLLGTMSIVVAATPPPPAPLDEASPMIHSVSPVAPAGMQGTGTRATPGLSAQALRASKEAPATATPGEIISYTITIQPYLVADMAMTDTLPVGVEYAGNLIWSAGNAWYDDAENTVFWEYVAPDGEVLSSAPEAYAWVVLATPPTATTRTAGAVDAAGRFYIIGGDSAAQGGQQRYGEVQRYDPAAGTWDNSLATMPVPLGGVCAAVVGDDIYIPGGLAGTTAHSELQVYHIGTNTWSTVTSDPLPQAIGAAACAAYGGKVYLIGGSTGAGYVDTTWVYDPAATAGSRWTNLTGVGLPSANGAALAVGDLIFYAGMRDSDSPDLPNVYAYDPAADTWTGYPDLTTPRGGAGMWAIGDLLLVGGGGWDTRLTSVEQYDSALGTGGTWSAFGASLVQGRRTFAFASDPVRGRLFAGNGYDGIILAEAEQLDFEGLPEPAEISFEVTVTGACGDEIVNQGVAELDGATAEFTATTVIGSPALISVVPPSLGAPVCSGTAGMQTLSICNEGDCPLDWQVEEQVPASKLAAFLHGADNVPWLSTNPVSGTVPGGVCQQVEVTFDATGLAPGDYTADLIILSNDPGAPATTVPVTLTAEACWRTVYLPAVMKGAP